MNQTKNCKKNNCRWAAALTAILFSSTFLFSGCGQTASEQSDTSTSQEVSAMQIGESNDNEASDTASSLSADTVFSELNTTDLDGTPIDASIFKENNLTLVNAWNIGCTPCVRELPALQQIHEEFAEKGVAIVGLYYNFAEDISDDELAQINETLADAGASYTQLRLTKEMYETETMQQVFAFPSTFIVDTSGTIVDKLVGANDYDGWKTAVEGYLSNMFCTVEGSESNQ